MESGNTLYKKPFITATIFLLLGFFSIIFGVYFADSTGDSNFYSLLAFGVFFIIISLVIFAVYGAMEMKFKSAINNQKLLDFYLNDGSFDDIAAKTGNEIKMNNKALLIIMLLFCAIFGGLSLFLGEDGVLLSGIFIGLGIFLTIMAFIITKYRVNKLKKGSKRVILSKNAAFVAGEFHTWNVPGSALIGARYYPRDGHNVKTSFIEIQYGALTVPGPSTYTFAVPIPVEAENRVNEIIGILLQQ